MLQMRGVRWRAALVVWLVLGTLMAAACSDSSGGGGPTTASSGTADSAATEAATVDTTSGSTSLPAPRASDPVFDRTADCPVAETWFEGQRGAPLKAPLPRAEVEKRVRPSLARLTAMRDSELVVASPGLGDATAVYEAYVQRLLNAWGDDGTALDNSLQGRSGLYFWAVMADPVVVDGRVVSNNGDEASSIIDAATDRVILACTAPPPGWERAVPQESFFEPPELTILANVTGTGRWSAIDLATGAATPALDGFGAVTPARGAGPVVGVAMPDRTLRVVDPATWTTAPIPETAGLSWQCPSWTVDGTSLVGAQLVGGIAVPSRVEMPGSSPPVLLPAAVEECAVSIGPGEVAFTGDDEVTAITETGEERTLLAMEDCTLVPFSAARDGVLDVYVNCPNPYLDGLHLVDVVSGEATHLIAGRVGAGDVSPDGRWRIFGYVPHGMPSTKVELWLRDAETGSTTRISEAGFGVPLFVDTDPAEGPG